MIKKILVFVVLVGALSAIAYGYFYDHPYGSYCKTDPGIKCIKSSIKAGGLLELTLKNQSEHDLVNASLALEDQTRGHCLYNGDERLKTVNISSNQTAYFRCFLTKYGNENEWYQTNFILNYTMPDRSPQSNKGSFANKLRPTCCH